MTIDTQQVASRRELSFKNFDDVLADAERCATGPCHTVGNWSVGQILSHLARAMRLSTAELGYWAPWPARLYIRWFVVPKILRRGMTAGFQLPANATSRLVPEPTSAAEGLAALRDAVEGFRHRVEVPPHPMFGTLSRDTWERMHLRHAELHLGFVQIDS